MERIETIEADSSERPADVGKPGGPEEGYDIVKATQVGFN